MIVYPIRDWVWDPGDLIRIFTIFIPYLVSWFRNAVKSVMDISYFPLIPSYHIINFF
jgi:hypothetical protein